jgi:hypothetical protein
MLGLTAGFAASLVILSDVRTPALVIDLDATTSDCSLERLVASGSDDEFDAQLASAAYLHTRVASRQLASRPSYNRDVSYALASLDVQLPSGGAYLSMGLNNDYDASYYWARHAGSNARRPVPGIDLRADSSGFAEIVRLTEEEARAMGNVQPNDGKWSEWCEFLRPGDQVDLVPASALAALRVVGGPVIGISRAGRPLGAEPEVVGSWTRG